MNILVNKSSVEFLIPVIVQIRRRGISGLEVINDSLDLDMGCIIGFQKGFINLYPPFE